MTVKSFLQAIILAGLVTQLDSRFDQCKFPAQKFNPQLEVQSFGKPTAFVATKSIRFSPYSLIDPYRQSTLYHEYLLIGPGIANYDTRFLEESELQEQDEEEIQLIVYDEEALHAWENDPNLVQHNLAKEYLWTLINATGMLPSMTVVNTTFEKTFRFHTDEGNKIAYHLAYPRLLRSQDTLPPLDVIIEFPAKTRMFQSLKTLIDYQTFGLLRWRLSPAEPESWKLKWDWSVTIKDDQVCSAPPDTADAFRNKTFLQCIYAKRFKILENPCIKDMLILYTIYGVYNNETDNSTHFAVNRIRIVIPMVYDILSHKGHLDLTDAYCPRPDLHEECGNPQALVLTNDHLVILTDKGLWVSSSLNASNVNASYPYSMKPLLKFTPIDPCAQFDNFNCSEVGTPVLASQTIRRQRLFYTPICHLFQYPIYEDMLIYVAEHITQSADLSRERDVVSVLFAAKPYNDWKILFHAQSHYTVQGETEPEDIDELLGIFYNPHQRHFDITLLLKSKTGRARRVRFVLKRPENATFTGYLFLPSESSDHRKKGFLEFEFPQSFRMTHFKVNPEPMDIFFLGNQIWIAEAGNAFPYVAILFVSDENSVPSVASDCSFNHPDRNFVCVEKSHSVIYPGRVGISYSSASVVFALANELRFTMLHNLWPVLYRQYVAMLGNFVVGYSGKIFLWYLYDPSDLGVAQTSLVNSFNTSTADCSNQPDIDQQPVKCHVCKRLTARIFKYGCKVVNTSDIEPVFKVASIDPSNLKSRNFETDGPLVPFLIDGDKVILYETSIPELENYKPRRNHFTDVDVGYKIFCTKNLAHVHNHTYPHTRRRRDVGSNWNDQWQSDYDYDRMSRQASTSPQPYNVTCPTLIEEQFKPSCEMYLRHTKSLIRHGEEAFLKGFRRILYATIITAFPLRPVPVDMIIIVQPNSNDVLIQLDTGMFEPGQAYTFSYDDVGQTLYIPEHFSVFLTGFPKYHCPLAQPATEPLRHDLTRMAGIATRYFRQGERLVLRPFKAYFVDFSTPSYCEWYRKTLRSLDFTQPCTAKPDPSDVISKAYRDRRDEMNRLRDEQYEWRNRFSQSVNIYHANYYKGANGTGILNLFEQLEPLTPFTYHDVEDELLTLKEPAVGKFQSFKFTQNKTTDPDEGSPEAWLNNTECGPSPWKIVDGGCHLRLYLSRNAVLKQNGGRISLDKYDTLSFQVKLRPLTALGKSLIHRPLIAVTNTGPDILSVETSEATGSDIQIMNITLSPTGFSVGLAAVTVRPLIISTSCLFADGSFTLIVLIQKAPGRRLHVNYPVPICKPGPDDGEFERPWKIDLPGCVTRRELFEKSSILRPDDSDTSMVFYSELPVNYRPPSTRGSEIPLTPNVYNADPSKPRYKEKYRISQETGHFRKCREGGTRDDCHCSQNDELSDDVQFTECKRMAYTARRGFRVDINVEYDRIMRDEDQHLNFFTPKKNWSVYLEEINNRVEFTLSSQNTPYLAQVNKDTNLNQGRRMYDAKTLGVTLHGTGLYHFKVTLGSFESFGEVSGHFMIMIPDDQLNHVQLVVIMLLTITVCMVFVFCGFLLVRRRLSSQLPFQTKGHADKIKLE